MENNTMESIDWLSTLVGTAIGAVISIVISSFFYKKSEKVKRLSMLYSSNILQTVNYQDINILYKGKSIDSLTKTILVIVNSGHKAIKSGDVDGFLSINTMPSVKLLSVEIKSSTKGIKPMAQKKNNLIRLSFNHLNPSDFILVEILHEGTLGNKDNFIIDHNPIIDGSVFISRYFDNESYIELQKDYILTYLGIFFVILMPIGFLYRVLYVGFDDGTFSMDNIFGILNTILFPLMYISAVYISMRLLKKYPTNRLLIASHKKIPLNVKDIFEKL